MIRETNGTIYITADAFCDRYNHAPRGHRFSYATGDLAEACELFDADARALRALLFEMERSGKLKLEMRESPGITAKRGATSFEYLATKCVMGAQAKAPHDFIEPVPEPA